MSEVYAEVMGFFCGRLFFFMSDGEMDFERGFDAAAFRCFFFLCFNCAGWVCFDGVIRKSPLF